MVAPGRRLAENSHLGSIIKTMNLASSIFSARARSLPSTLASRWGARLSLALATGLLATCPWAQAQTTQAPSAARASTKANPETNALLAALNGIRERGCASAAPSDRKRTAFVLEPHLSDAAARVAGGLPLAAALKASTYVAPRSAVVSLSGYPNAQAFAEGAAQHSCNSLTDPAFRDIGIHTRGNSVWIVMAEPFEPPAASQAADVAAQVLALVNAARAQPRRCGDQAMPAAGPLQLNARLNASALSHAQDMAQHSYFSHTGRDGSQVGARATKAGYAWRQIGENIAAGQMRPEMAVDGWLKSPGHCVNLMRPQYTEMGLSFAVNLTSDNSIYWVQVFGTPR